jgi:formate-dependent nitrite reductase cytochrome c552 subunit
MQRVGSIIAMTICMFLVVVISCLGPREDRPSSHNILSPIQVKLPESGGMPKNNMLCFVCHVNFAENDAIADHISEGITCAHCHGKSIDHMNDESMMTTPDILYGRDEVEELCIQCHRQLHNDPQAVDAFLKKWNGQKRENGRNVTEDSTCTDCHGRHTIPHR